MKQIHQVSFYLSLIIVTYVSIGCEDKCTRESKYVYYEPVFATAQQIRDATIFEAPREVSYPGKIYIKDHYLFLNEAGKGIHVYNNANPKTPVPIGFLAIPGNFDLAISGNTLYADSYADVVVFDISNLTQIKEVNRLERFFDSQEFTFYNAQAGSYVIDWEKKEDVVVTELDCNSQPQPWGGVFYEDGILLEAASTQGPTTFTAPTNKAGVGGSMARFTIHANHLYALEGDRVKAIDITMERNPVPGNAINLSWDIETIFPYGDKLFVGSQSGMYILDAGSPDNIKLISVYQHVRSCDPVVVDGTFAYVTLRNGTECAGFVNQLEVIDISDVNNPALVSVYPMTNPHGLGIDKGTLFLCDGDAGLKVFNATDPLTIDQNMLAHYSDIHAFDVIPFENIAILIGQDGLYQYDYSAIDKITLLSVIPFAR